MRNITYKSLLWMLPCVALALLSGCNMAILDPKGAVGAEEKSLIITATWLMLIVVVPVIVLVFVFAWRYRASNKDAKYEPEWDHSNKIEAVVWAVPCIIIVCLAVITWTSSHKLDPYRPLDSTAKPINIDVVALDWKWLFIYPDYNIATVNQIAFPAHVPVNFRITSDSVMNSFFIPRLGGQIYAMAGMVTKLHLIADEEGSYDGLSANYSGNGFSDMHFKALATSDQGFQEWVKKAQSTGQALDTHSYQQVALPSNKSPVEYFSSVEPNLYRNIINKYMDMSAHMKNSNDHSGMHAVPQTAAPDTKQGDQGTNMSMEMHSAIKG